MHVYVVYVCRMDPALLRERELFKRRALSNPAVEKRQAPSEASGSSKKKKSKPDRESSSSKNSTGQKFLFNVCECLKLVYLAKLKSCAPRERQGSPAVSLGSIYW